MSVFTDPAVAMTIKMIMYTMKRRGEAYVILSQFRIYFRRQNDFKIINKFYEEAISYRSFKTRYILYVTGSPIYAELRIT